jgi:hypothetical protein
VLANERVCDSDTTTDFTLTEDSSPQAASQRVASSKKDIDLKLYNSFNPGKSTRNTHTNCEVCDLGSTTKHF